ncbi:MAG: flagellar protein export ATPase FliI [Marinomonas foliarum]|uniref:Flagellum-specific ATP synthase n=1 Tax=Marinomonas foliarum TaxID=491950 RepID=A0A369AI97_9GAMM|nr:flagellar protein export ATPase FliI [Marinomonas foliarum]QRV23207.1 flagellar protein export ATPase FliI [Marinomonas foliarum]RCX08843.1 flagellum-specific ATP synthase [Marinomonas foliarum]
MSSLKDRFNKLSHVSLTTMPPQIEGKVTRMVGLTMEAVGCVVALGDRCSVQVRKDRWVESEVVGFTGDLTYLMPTEAIEGISPGARVRPLLGDSLMPVGDELLGRVVNGLGKPLDGKGKIKTKDSVTLHGDVINPLQRKPINEPLDVGIKAINSLLTVGKGQRLGLFAGSGVGKSMLLGMMTKYTEADITIVGLIGERGREVKEFIDQILGEEGLSRSVVVASPADDSALMRLRAAMLATRIAEYYRDQGKNVLLLMDSLTRYAQAQREIALSVGEPPATKGYPPSVFSKLPQLVERAGNGCEGSGSVTAFYTVLTEGDDQQDPIADASRAILDGHIVLSRRLAEEGHYPAIDIEASISRAMPHIVSEDHLYGAMRVKQLYSKFQQNQDLISVGAYARGSDPDLDQAILQMPDIREFLQQSLTESFSIDESLQALVTAMTKAQ